MPKNKHLNLTMKSAVVERHHSGEFILAVSFNETDEIARIFGSDQKWTIHKNRLLFLGANFEDFVEPINLPADPADGLGATRLRGFTADPVIFDLFQSFIAQKNADQVFPSDILFP